MDTIIAEVVSAVIAADIADDVGRDRQRTFAAGENAGMTSAINGVVANDLVVRTAHQRDTGTAGVFNQVAVNNGIVDVVTLDAFVFDIKDMVLADLDVVAVGNINTVA